MLSIKSPVWILLNVIASSYLGVDGDSNGDSDGVCCVIAAMHEDVPVWRGPEGQVCLGRANKIKNMSTNRKTFLFRSTPTEDHRFMQTAKSDQCRISKK